MAEDSIIYAGASPEDVAYKLLHDIAKHAGDKAKDPKWILDTYAECITTVRAPSSRKK